MGMKFIDVGGSFEAVFDGVGSVILRTKGSQGPNFHLSRDLTYRLLQLFPGEKKTRPRVVCLCGSTRFTREMMLVSWDFAKRGIIALGWCVLPDGYFEGDGAHGAEVDNCKEQLDELHKHKIDLSDDVLVLNIGGYIGDSTKSEIEYAMATGRPVAYLETRVTT